MEGERWQKGELENGRHHMMAQVVGSLPLAWETWTEFLAPGHSCPPPPPARPSFGEGIWEQNQSMGTLSLREYKIKD